MCASQHSYGIGSKTILLQPDTLLNERLMELLVNSRRATVDAPPDTPLLYVLMNDLALKGPRFGCGLAQCGSCSVLIDGVE